MKIAITGSNGQVGQALQAALENYQVLPLTRPNYEVGDSTITRKLIELNPDLIIHPAALTNVDECAKNPQSAYLINAFGTQNVALACQQIDIPLIYISTNEVFDGKTNNAYHEFATPHAINAYGQSKLAGERIAAQLLKKLYIVRTAWVFSSGGNNFPSKIIQAADKHRQLQVVTDEISNPTYAPDLAQAVAKLMRTDHYGLYHLVNEGICSRYDYAVEILAQSGRREIPVAPITSDSFERASTPPAYTPLQNNLARALDITLRPWQEALANYLQK